MKLKVSKLAHIDSALFNDDSDLTIIVGDNGTGKTLLLETYALINEEIYEVRSSILSKILVSHNDLFEVIFDQTTKDLLSNIFLSQKNILEELDEEDFMSNQGRRLIYEKLVKLYPGVETGLELKVNININNTSQLNDSIELYSNQMKTKLINQIESKILFNSSKIENIEIFNEIPILSNVNDFNFNLRITPTFWRIDKLIFDRVFYSKDKLEELSFESLERRLRLIILQNFITSKFDKNFVDTSQSEVLLIPTERNSIIANSNLRTRKELENSKIFSRYSEFSFTLEFLKFKEELGQLDFDFFDEPDSIEDTVINVFLEDLSDKNDHTSDKGDTIFNNDRNTVTRDHSEHFSKMLGGNLVHDKEGKIDSLIDFKGNKISSRLFSTKQNHISSFAILDENINQYDVVIIEEPEANLSLKAIKQLVDYLFYLIKNHKIKFILTTHNELFFQRMNLLLLANEDISSRVYEFKQQEETNSLVELNIGEFGYKVDLFDSELKQIFKESNKIQSSLQKEKLDDSFS